MFIDVINSCFRHKFTNFMVQAQLIDHLRDESLRANKEAQDNRSKYLQLQHKLSEDLSASSMKDAVMAQMRSDLVCFYVLYVS